MLRGFTPPITPTGRSALVPPPPWHYAGEVLSLALDITQAAGQSFRPDGFGRATGRAYARSCEWQATTDGSELLDPVSAQYKEFFILIEADLPPRDERALFCPLIWVDQDISMVRGHLQGWPKRLGQIWRTRSHDLDHPAAARRQAGARLGATPAVKDRRLAEAEVTLTGALGRSLGFLALPTYGLLALPTILEGETAIPPRLVRAAVSARGGAPLTGALGTIRLFEGPRDELAGLAPQGPIEVSLGAVALTISGATEDTPW